MGGTGAVLIAKTLRIGHAVKSMPSYVGEVGAEVVNLILVSLVFCNLS